MSADGAHLPGADPCAAVQAWRAGVDADAHPVRLRRIEALARRTQAVQGAARRLLLDRLDALMENYGAPASAAPCTPAAPADPGPLQALTERLTHHDAAHVLRARAASGDTELLRHVQGVWSLLTADRRLAQSLATVPDQAGPLNSQHLTHRALAAMRQASPAYFQHFVAQVDALLALDAMLAPVQAPPAPATPRLRKPRPARGA